jgi:uncharacterized membrane protein
MQDVLPLEAEPGENKLNSLQKFVISGLSFLCWVSPMIGLDIFFPLGVLVLYQQNQKLRIAAFQSLMLQVFIQVVLYPMDLYSLYSFETEAFVMALKQEYAGLLFLFWSFVGLILLFIEARFLIRKYGTLHLFNEKPKSVAPVNPVSDYEKQKWEDYQYHRVEQTEIAPITSTKILIPPDFNKEKNSFFKTFVSVVIVWIIAIVWFFCICYFFAMLNTENYAYEETLKTLDSMFKGPSALYLWFMTLLSASSFLGRKRILSILRRPYVSLYIHTKLSKTPTSDFFSSTYAKKQKYARIRERILPGWGHIYLHRYWKGFPILFTFLLVFFFLIISLTFYTDTTFGLNFLRSLGLKPGIHDKEFIPASQNIAYPIALSFILSVIYIFANSLLGRSLKKDGEPITDRGLQSGFTNNVYLSLLAHLIILSILFIVPERLQRNSSKKKQDMSKNHYQPEKMEYYFIDPDIPDEVKDLNGGVIAGTETPSQKDGLKIPDNPMEDQGKVKGYVKRIKGKKLPRTYSNYISARMRGPENFMEYWKRAPHPYSCVVAYTITTDGEIVDVILVEGSAYPDQDNLTLELIRSMSPVMPPPNVKGDVRVTELFWNGSIDPDAMPTPLQKDMVLHFDGRFMEEEF